MNYKELIENSPNKSEKKMWASVTAISDMLDKLKEKEPKMVHDFILDEYEMMYGPHFNEAMAKEAVSEMHHKKDGANIVGEIIPVEECVSIVSDGKRDMVWDAYVGMNAFAHDLARANLSKEDLVATAYEFWFNDDDFPEEKSKVWWYFRNK